jgi:hypothetical protein
VSDRLPSEATNKARQLGRHNLPRVLAILSDHVFASILLDRLAAECLMTSASLINVPLNGKRFLLPARKLQATSPRVLNDRGGAILH